MIVGHLCLLGITILQFHNERRVIIKMLILRYCYDPLISVDYIILYK